MSKGYGPALRAFRKLKKPPFAFSRSEDNFSALYVDNCNLQRDSFTECAANVIRKIEIR